MDAPTRGKPGEGVPLISREKEVEVRQIEIQDIQVVENFISIRTVRIALQLNVS